MSRTVLLVDDEPQILLTSSIALRSAGITDVIKIDDGREVMPVMRDREVATVVLDLFMKPVNGKELLSMIVDEFSNVPVLVMTAANEVDTAVDCMKTGAFDYLVKPVEEKRFVNSVNKALEVYALRNEVSSLKDRLFSDGLQHEDAFAAITTGSKKMKAIFQYIEAIAGTQQPVLITGETGVGKELVARAVHQASGRKGNFVAVDVAGLDDIMFSDTLFGHKKGAYTGAMESREGLIAKASGGTLFLDEIGDLKESSQIKLLRLLQEHSYYPLGSDEQRQTDARVVVATNKGLHELAANGSFRKDLYYRFRAHQVHIPPLRERREDIPLLLDLFVERATSELGKENPSYTAELLQALLEYAFPGNVRELEAMVFDAVASHGKGDLSVDAFREIAAPLYQVQNIAPQAGESSLLSQFSGFPTIREATDFLIAKALEASKGNQGAAASMLGITRQALNKRLRRQRED